MSRWLWLTALAIALTVAAMTAVGAALEEAHEVRVSTRFDAPPEAVFATISDFERSPSWRDDLDRVDLLSKPGEPVRFQEIGEHGAIVFEVDASEPPRLLVTRIADRDLAFGGSWTYEIEPDGEGASLTITERGEIRNPLFRFLARFVLGYDATLSSYVESLERALEGSAREGGAAPP